MYQDKIYFTFVNPVNNFLTFENVMYEEYVICW